MGAEQTYYVDITPSPRILRTLGEIPFEPWQCFAELIDNCIDALESATRQGKSLPRKQIILSWSSEDVASSERRVEIRDTAPGLDLATIQNCVRAGYSTNDPVNSLGLFGMGFNIATARLGDKTLFLSTKAGETEWTGVEIDFEAISKGGTFQVPVVRLDKSNIDDQGTRVIISKLKPEIYDILRKRESQIRATLEDIYSPILTTQPELAMLVNGKRCKPKPYCVWGEDRYVVRSNQKKVNAIIRIDENVGVALFDLSKNRYLSLEEETMAYTFKEENGVFPSNIVERQKRVHGWLGIQRFADPTFFGIDFVRNGRKILRKDKSLFKYYFDITGTEIVEYPIELGSTQGGRIVGEIHVDHLVPTYQKNDFDRTDRSWFEVVNILRGDGPLLPGKRKELGFADENNSPLGRLVNAYRRLDPGTRNLAIPQAIAKEWRLKFERGEEDYQDDSKWWEAAQQEDQKRADGGPGTAPPPSGSGMPSDNPDDYSPPGFGGDTATQGGDTFTVAARGTAAAPQGFASPEDEFRDLFNRSEQDLRLSRDYGYRNCPSPVHVEARKITTGAILGVSGDEPVKWDTRNFNQLRFFYDPRHQFFRSFRFSPHEIMLLRVAELLIARDRLDRDLSLVYIELLESMFPDERVDKLTVQEHAKSFFDELRDAAVDLLMAREAEVLDAIHSHAGELEETMMGLVSRPEVQNLLQNRAPGGLVCLDAVPERTLVRLVSSFPEEFFDGKFFRINYQQIILPSSEATERIREETKERIINFMKDALWVLSPRNEGSRDEYLRCAHSLDLLKEAMA